MKIGLVVLESKSPWRIRWQNPASNRRRIPATNLSAKTRDGWAKLIDAVTKSANDAEFVKMAANPDSYQPLRVLGPDDFAKDLKNAEAEFRALWKDDPWLK